MMKKWAGLALALSLAPASVSAAAAVTAPPSVVKVEYSQKPIHFPDQKPVIKDSRTLVPIRPIAEGLGFDVDWNEQNRSVVIKKGDTQIKLVVSQKIARRNGETIPLDVPAQIINKRTMVPVRFIAEALSYEVNWDTATQTVSIADKTPEKSQQQTAKAAEEATAVGTGVPQPKSEPPAAGNQPSKESQLVDSESISARLGKIMGLTILSVKGKAEPDSSLVLNIEGVNYEVPINPDGSFLFELVEKNLSVEEYTLAATRGDEEQTLEGKFTLLN